MAELRTQSDGVIVVVYFQSPRLVEEPRINQVKSELLAVASQLTEGNLLVNFQGVDHVASLMLTALIGLRKRCNEQKIVLKLCSVSPKVMEVFRITQLDKTFDILPDEAAGLGAFKRAKWFGFGGAKKK